MCKTAIEILDEMGIYRQLLDEDKAKVVMDVAVFSTMKPSDYSKSGVQRCLYELPGTSLI